MKRFLVLVEGLTEERFVKDYLVQHLASRSVLPIPKILTTKRMKNGPDFKGGVHGYAQVKDDLRRLLGDSGAVAITTLLDYYALPADFPGMDARPPGAPRARVEHVEHAFAADIEHPRFRPHLVLHELEAWVFSDPVAASWIFDEPRVAPALQAIRDSFTSPEDIDEGITTAPSRRILGEYSGYQKTFHGPLAVAAIGLERVRARCPHFAAWLSWLESFTARENRPGSARQK
jgi:Domain of unknown function (DUF4276)